MNFGHGQMAANQTSKQMKVYQTSLPVINQFINYLYIMFRCLSGLIMAVLELHI